MSDVVEFLEQGGLGEPVERVDTHGAHVFIGRESAWKMKRPVTFRFLDFGSLAQREQVIRQELELNRRTAPSIYHRVVPVVRRPSGELALDREGEPVEWLLVMRRFDRGNELDRMAQQGRLDPELVARLARGVAKFHQEAAVVPKAGGYQGLFEVVAGNTDDLLDLCPLMFERAAVVELDRLSKEELERHRALLDRRRDAGRVRHCHGDLHLGNVVMLDGVPTPFDCLEFDPALASIDVIYDLAFLIMDLLQRGLPVHAQRALQGWIEVTEDDEAPALLPLCLATRAAVRAKIEGLQERPDMARSYLDLALRCFDKRPARLVALGGVSGTGKTTVARGLAPDLGPAPGAVILRSDVVRKKLFGKDPEERLGPDAYNKSVSRRVFARMNQRAAVLLSSGHAVIADGVFGEPEQRTAVEQVASSTGLPFSGLWLTARRDILRSRVAARRNDASDANVAVLMRQLRGIDQAKVGWTHVDASGAPETVIELASQALRSGG